MKVTYNWLKDFVEIKIPPRDLANKLTMSGLEVISLEEKGGDFIFEIEITSNRPDWLSVVGIAREVAAITGAKLKKQKSLSLTKNRKAKDIALAIEDKSDCPLYTARIIRNVKVAPSAPWLKARLELVGCRSVNNIVDITNYVLFELGEPLHAFDLDKLNKERIVVRRAHPGEKITTIDGIQRVLSKEQLVIADDIKTVAIAGVMGAKDSEVSINTKNVLLEAAVFNPLIVRRGRQALGLQSEASYRFERGVDIEAVERASLRAAELIKEYASGEEIAFKAVGLSKAKSRIINLDVADVTRILGLNIPVAKIKKNLSGLGFGVKSKSKNTLAVSTPSFRQDVSLKEDLIEEVSRIFGYERIPVSLPAIKSCVSIRGKRGLVSEVKNILTGLGLSEVATYSLTDRASLAGLELGFSNEPIEILNPLSQEQEVLRTTLIPGLTSVVAFNLNQKQEYIPIFEVANVYLRDTNHPKEELMLGLALSGAQPVLLNNGALKDEVSLLNLKGMLETLFSRLGIKDYEFNSTLGSEIVEIYAQRNKIGSMSRLSNSGCAKSNIKNKNVFLAELSLDKVLSIACTDKKFISPPRYPGITRDISFILKEDISVKDILKLFKQSGVPLLQSVRIADYYKGKQIPSGFKGLTLTCFYSSVERTLKEDEIQPLHTQFCERLTKEFGVKMR